MPRRRKLKTAQITLAVNNDVVADRRAANVSKQHREVFVEVDNPYYDPTKPDSENANPKRIIASRSARDPLSWMASRGIIDEPQRSAGEQWRDCWRLSQFGTLGAMDPGKERVNGGKIYDPISDKQIWAAKYLYRCRIALGDKGNFIIHRVLADNLFPEQIANLYGERGDGAVKKYRILVKDYLQQVALVFTVRS